MRMVPYMPLSQHQDDDRQFILHGGREFLAVHQEIAVAADRNDQRARDKAACIATAAGTP